ncbi:MAG: S26 family signal peptidase [Archaeoglobaceae archaeon]|nr:S26 family signal peptidase [Archaeoglobaceae archaeon]MDW7989513.1 S26 family signal peptidase [Archaeoglobaceae archaeon]
MLNKSNAFKFIKDLVSTVAIVVLVVGAGIAITGCWPFMVAVESGSMQPNLMPGDVVILMHPSRVGLITWAEGRNNGYKSFGDYGDVIVYYPNGNGKPIIHRAIAFVEEGEKIPILSRGEFVYSENVAQISGYITQGDANRISDQLALLRISGKMESILPVQKEWIIGVAKFRIPLIGYFRLLIPV